MEHPYRQLLGGDPHSQLHWHKRTDPTAASMGSSMYLPLVGEAEGKDAEIVVLCGPIIGKVTQTSAVILLEVDTDTDVTCRLTATDGTALEKTVRFEANVPSVFHFRSLTPNTRYNVGFTGLAKCYLEDLHSEVATLPAAEEIKKVKFIGFSCDRFSRLEENDENPWGKVLGLVAREDVTALLHLGDQVYMSQWGYLTRATQALLHHDRQNKAVQQKMHKRALNYLRDAYRDTWSFPEVRQVMAKCQHLMIWSDNDVANDFTVLKDENGNQAYSDELLMCGMKVYREYQRQLWDPTCRGKLPHPGNAIEEWQFHRFGPCGVFIFDMRGNRITSGGTQQDTNPLMSERQRAAVQEALATPGISFMIMASEIPMIGDEPSTIKEKVKHQPFLVDHWPYNDEELTWLLDQFFAWKAEEPGREMLLLGGDIHVGVESMVFDSETGQNLKQITASPITNHVTPFFPDLEGRINERYTFCHRPLPDQRNYCVIEADFDDDNRVSYFDARLVGVPTQAMLAKLQKHSLKDMPEIMKHADKLYAGTVTAGNLQGELVVHVNGVRKIVGIEDAGEVELLCSVRVGNVNKQSETVSVVDGVATFDEDITFTYHEEDFFRFALVLPQDNELIGHADFSLAPIVKGWSTFEGTVPLYSMYREEIAQVEMTVSLK